MPDRRAAPPSLRLVAVAVTGLERVAVRPARRQRPVTPVERTLRLRVADARDEAEDVRSLVLAAMDERPLPAWRPGAHLDLTLPSGLRRQYSLCGNPDDRGRYRIAVRRVPGGTASAEVHRLPVGARLSALGPRNAFPLAGARAYRFVAGGIGITPILPMVRAVAARGADWTLGYVGRSRSSLPFLDELAVLDPGRVHVVAGHRPSAEALLAGAEPGTALYVCGPPGLVDALRTVAVSRGLAEFHHERFVPRPVVGGAPFEVRLARTGRTVTVPADRSALDAIRDVLPHVRYSCRQGFCGTCPVVVLDGDVEHRDRCLTPPERADHMALCVSRGTTHITLDL